MSTRAKQITKQEKASGLKRLGILLLLLALVGLYVILPIMSTLAS